MTCQHASAWPDGSTAPRDGTPIIAFWKGRTIAHDCCEGVVWRDGAWFVMGDPDGDDTVADPDYWMPWPNREQFIEWPLTGGVNPYARRVA